MLSPILVHRVGEIGGAIKDFFSWQHGLEFLWNMERAGPNRCAHSQGINGGLWSLVFSLSWRRGG